MKKVNIHDFGIYLQLEPDEEEKANLEQNIQIALQQQQIDLEDAIDLREINNIKLANQMLKQRRLKKQERDQQIAQQNIQAQAQANAETAERAAMAEVQKQQAIAETQIQIEQGKSQMRIQEMQTKGEIDKQLMGAQFEYDRQLKSMDMSQVQEKERFIEDRKDKRAKLEATQQSQMMNQQMLKTPPIDFEDGSEGVSGPPSIPTALE